MVDQELRQRIEGFTYKVTEEKEFIVLVDFKKKAIPYISVLPQNDWDWLAVAQHHGLPTRLMDWTLNPLVAAFFAVEDLSEADGVIYVLEKPSQIPRADFVVSPFSLEETRVFYPRHASPRISAQSGLFTAHPSPTIEYEEDEMQNG